MNKLINNFNFISLKDEWKNAKPFNHIVLDDFLAPDAAARIVKEFPDFTDDNWYVYDNAIEIKKTMNLSRVWHFTWSSIYLKKKIL